MDRDACARLRAELGGRAEESSLVLRNNEDLAEENALLREQKAVLEARDQTREHLEGIWDRLIAAGIMEPEGEEGEDNGEAEAGPKDGSESGSGEDEAEAEEEDEDDNAGAERGAYEEASGPLGGPSGMPEQSQGGPVANGVEESEADADMESVEAL